MYVCVCDVHGCVCRWLQEGLTSSLTTRTPWRFAVLGRWYGLLLMGTPERGQTLFTNTPVPTACRATALEWWATALEQWATALEWWYE